MLTGRIRSADTVTVDVEGDTLAEVQDALAAAGPSGYELLAAPVQMRKGSITLDATGTFEARGEVREIEGPNLQALRERVPAGWRLLSVTAS